MRSIISFCAEGIVRDVQTNNISAFNILERLSSPAFPLFIPRMFFFCLLEREETEDSVADFKLIAKNNEEVLFENSITSDFQTGLRNRQTVEIGGIPISQPGELSFNLYFDELLVAEYSIEIRNVGTPTIIQNSE